MTDGDPSVFHQRQRQHAGHPAIFFVLMGAAEDAIIGGGDGGFDALFGGSIGPSHGLADGLHGRLRGQLAGGLPTNAIHYQEQAAIGVHPKAVFVVFTQQTCIGSRTRDGVHERPSRVCTTMKSTTKARKAITNGMCKSYSHLICEPRS
jgi:hypothetical protein